MSESNAEYFNRRVREAADDTGAVVASCGISADRDAFEAVLTLAGEHGVISVEPAELRSHGDHKLAFRELADRSITLVTDALYAVTHTEIPAGAVFMALGARRVFGSDDTASPITKIDRARRVFWRFGTSEPFPWPQVVYYNQGRHGFVERIS